MLEQRRAQAGRAFHARAVVEIADHVDRHLVVLDAPRAGDVEVLEREAQRIDHAVARVAARVVAMLLHALARRQHLAAFVRLHRIVERRHVGRRRRRRRCQQHFHHPLAALHRRGAIGDRGQRQDAALAEQAAAIRRQRHALERVAGDVRDVVVNRQPLVHERVVGGQQIEQAAILAHDRIEEELGLLLHRLGERVVVLRIQQVVREDLVEVLQAQPLRRKPRRQRFRSLVGEHAAHLLLDARRRSCSEPRLAARISSASGTVPHRKNDRRDAMSSSARRKLAHGADADAVGCCSRRNRKRGLIRIDCTASRMPASKPPFSRPCS